uniref:Putative secreted protein n=1 Tax=Ixodes scapularis TaxID=6945 RepID=A0A4D5RD25_IXOSC
MASCSWATCTIAAWGCRGTTRWPSSTTPWPPSRATSSPSTTWHRCTPRAPAPCAPATPPWSCSRMWRSAAAGRRS